jgi:predicted nucleic acid-binding protein
MARRQPKATPPLIYIDSCVYIDLVVKNAEVHKKTGLPRWHSAKEVFDAVNHNRARLAASALIEAEVCCNGLARKDSARVRDLLNGWFTAPSTSWTDVDRFLARDAVRLTKEHAHKRENKARSFGGADATHVAAAIRLGCDYLITHDEGFPIGHTIEGVQVIRPEAVWPATLMDHLEEAAGA